jgi:hypothetical protein
MKSADNPLLLLQLWSGQSECAPADPPGHVIGETDHCDKLGRDLIPSSSVRTEKCVEQIDCSSESGNRDRLSGGAPLDGVCPSLFLPDTRNWVQCPSAADLGP